ncbi:hypothetical protein HF313_00540 [Massilia atriviolacea]|uniref:Uncharacterized protein n=1 Tax=Massilia atriviolacea TaxID=2495579 RepID=A0A430HL43_9BURK|nr:hypothetical protein [Massilia atriviolacea]RSZ58223.1 hypothetical protein EJB06_14770 [Massilia atriviolacea]
MTDIAILPTLLQNRLRAALHPGERLVWVGRPIAARFKGSAYGYPALPASTAYAITGARVILLGGGDDADSVRSYLPAQLQQLERTEHEGGWGDLILETAYLSDDDGGYTAERHGLLAIAGVRRVHGLVAALASTLPLAPRSAHAGVQKALLAPATGALPARLRQALQAELGPGERLVWAAQPIPASYLKKGLRKWFFFIPWTLFTLFLIVVGAPAVWNAGLGGWDRLLVIGVPVLFLWIGLHHLVQPFRMRREALGVVHAITTARALTIDLNGAPLVRTYAPAGLVHARCADGPGGSGDLRLEASAGHAIPIERQVHRHGFMGIDKVRHVEGLIGHLKQAPATGN